MIQVRVRARVDLMTRDELEDFAAHELGWTKVSRAQLAADNSLLEIMPDQETFWVSADGTRTRSERPNFTRDIAGAWSLVEFVEKQMPDSDFSLKLSSGHHPEVKLAAEFKTHTLTALAEENAPALAITRAFVFLMAGVMLQ